MRSFTKGLVVCLALFSFSALVSAAANENKQKNSEGNALSRKDRQAEAKQQRENYINMRKKGVDEVSNTKEAAEMRDYRLRQKKRKGLVRKRDVSLASVLFPGVSAVEYKDNEEVMVVADLVESRKTQVPYEFYDLPTCDMPKLTPARKKLLHRKNLGARLQGHDLKPAPFVFNVKQNHGCKDLCEMTLSKKDLTWMRKLVERQYRIQLSLDQLPVLMRSKELNYAARGYPVGFKAPPSLTGLKTNEIYLYNHLKFTVTYREEPSEFDGIRITGFDVHPVSVQHTEKNGKLTCGADSEIANVASSYLALRSEKSGEAIKVLYSFEVKWEQSDLLWSDRWDVYLIGGPDDDIHYFAIVNSLMIVLFLTGAIATIMIRTLRKDIAGYNEMQTLEEAQDETGWKLVHGDVFRPPQFSPMLLSVAVGTGTQIGVAFFFAMMCAILGVLNPMKKGQTLTAILLLYVFSGGVAGYVSARLYKFCEATAWKRNAILTATALPAILVAMFSVLNVFLSFVGAATAVSFLTILVLFSLWVCVSAPLVFVGSYFGLRAKSIETPTKTNQIARIVPPLPWHVNPLVTALCGGILPFGSVCIELAFIMSALWLHQIYYVMGFLLAVLLILTATCAQVSVVMCYLNLCAEDHRWWWKSFFNTASAGFYMFLYSLWFLSSRLDLVGILPVVVYLTYMSMISICFGLFCGGVGVLSSFCFTRIIYGAVKVD